MMKSDYVVQYGVNFSHMTEYELFTLYRDAVKFYSDLDDIYQSAVVYRCDYDKRSDRLGYIAADKVEYKKSRFELKQNDRLLAKMAAGERL